ncbi:lipopolysaccharide export LptBFGC system permease protein LptF [Rhizomicrobium palustre]|uniref:Lipopolysaccharide export LptBFGC system permease protein LptF n=1 Tax=Rhizomicrobium palustre TaxID=189966 RepID=A0A846MVI8_9PROT|nr:LptF/LptG family permease [Rhizomicrobium palustre]NIK87386.1 lipopolysaccharide export LptBFGC system permease protein LptF [Rhizomicrobium palustre]
MKASGILGTILSAALSVLRFVAGPFAQLYARRFFGGVALLVFVVMVLFEAVFLAERFPMVFRAVYQHHADPTASFVLLMWNSTQVVDLALAIAVLVGVYWTTLRLRENRELLVLVAAGTGPFHIVNLVLMVAVLALIGSITVSGVLDPAARFAERQLLFNAEFRALRTGINTGQFYEFPGRVAFAPAHRAAKNAGPNAYQTRGLFVYEDIAPGKFRVVTADHARLEGPDAQGSIVLKLGGFTSQSFAAATPGENANAEGGKTSHMGLLSGDVTQAMMADQLLTFEPRGSHAEEMSIFDQFAQGQYVDNARHREDMRLLGERLSRSFLCLLAPFIALACVCMTNRKTNYFALPLACMALMSLNVTSVWLVKVIVPLDPWGALRTPAIVTAVLAALLLAEIYREQAKLAQPQLARP